jgi:hypothetical protein
VTDFGLVFDDEDIGILSHTWTPALLRHNYSRFADHALTWIKAARGGGCNVADVEDDDELADCALALIRRHGIEAAERAQRCADAHLAVGEDEDAAFWSALAQTIRRMTLQSLGRGQ